MPFGASGSRLLTNLTEMKMWKESFMQIKTRYSSDHIYRVIDGHGVEHGFMTAAEANAEFPDAFDEHLDLDLQSIPE